MPGHPVDHLDIWLKPMLAMGQAALPAAPPMPQLFQVDAMLAPWSAWMKASGLGMAPTSQISMPGPEALFDAAFSAYRSAGGHAVAQIARGAGVPAPPTGVTSPVDMMWGWPMLMPMSGWYRR